MKIFAIAAAAAMISGVAYAQKAPIEQKANLDASTETQIEQGEGAEQNERSGFWSSFPMIDFGATASIEGSANVSEDTPVHFRTQGNIDDNAKSNLTGR